MEWLFSGVQCITAAMALLAPFYLCRLCPPPLWKALEGFSYGMDEGLFLPFLGTCALWVPDLWALWKFGGAPASPPGLSQAAPLYSYPPALP